MAVANIVIAGITLTPNPVQTNGKIKIEVEIKDRNLVINTDDGYTLTTADGMAIEVVTQVIDIIQATDGEIITTTDGTALEVSG